MLEVTGEGGCPGRLQVFPCPWTRRRAWSPPHGHSYAMEFELCCETALLLRVLDDYTLEALRRNNNLPTKMLSRCFQQRLYSDRWIGGFRHTRMTITSTNSIGQSNYNIRDTLKR